MENKDVQVHVLEHVLQESLYIITIPVVGCGPTDMHIQQVHEMQQRITLLQVGNRHVRLETSTH